MREPDFVYANCEADQRLCFRYTDSTIPLLLKSEISSFYPFSVAAHAGLCRIWSETPKTDFLVSRLKFIIWVLLQQNTHIQNKTYTHIYIKYFVFYVYLSISFMRTTW